MLMERTHETIVSFISQPTAVNIVNTGHESVYLVFNRGNVMWLNFSFQRIGVCDMFIVNRLLS